MSSLVEIHEVHVDLFVRNLEVVLRGEVAVRLLQIDQTVDPHLRRGEGVAPGNDAGTLLVVVGLGHDVANLAVAHRGHLIDQLAGQDAGGVERFGHLGGALGNGVKDSLSIQVLAADDKPEFILIHTHVHTLLLC